MQGIKFLHCISSNSIKQCRSLDLGTIKPKITQIRCFKILELLRYFSLEMLCVSKGFIVNTRIHHESWFKRFDAEVICRFFVNGNL